MTSHFGLCALDGLGTTPTRLSVCPAARAARSLSSNSCGRICPQRTHEPQLDPAQTVREGANIRCKAARPLASSRHQSRPLGAIADAEAIRARKACRGIANKVRLHESDYLLGVHDAFRAGALRFRLNDSGIPQQPTWRCGASIRSVARVGGREPGFERDEISDAVGDNWLRMLIVPGGSLGGAARKPAWSIRLANCGSPNFPACGTSTMWGVGARSAHAGSQFWTRYPEGIARRFANRHHTFLVKRFDRTVEGRRLHFASTMTLTGHKDGDDASTGASYLEIARVLINYGAQTNADLLELWSRIVLTCLCQTPTITCETMASFLSRKGWRLSPAFDMNPVADSHALKLNISESDNAMDLDLARAVAPYFRVTSEVANATIERGAATVSQWRKIAVSLGISNRERQERMALAFRLAA